MNVPGLQGRVGLYTNRRVSDEYDGVRRGDVYVDFGDFPPQDIVAAFVLSEKQDMVFANLVRGLDWNVWRELVALLAKDGFRANDKKIGDYLSYTPKQNDVSIAAVKNNLVPAIRRLHRAGATLGQNMIEELRQARVVIVDISLLGSEDGLAIIGLILRRVFQHNLRHLTEVGGPSVRCLAVLEEAQTVLGDRRLDDNNIFVRWVKEGRKYGLGAILVTQQPGAIAPQIISQGDNFFALHLLNDNDLQTLKRHNAYYTDEILNYLRAEPIIGNCYFWSAPNQPFVLPVRVCNFESVCQKPTLMAPSKSTVKKSTGSVPQAIKDALETNSRVWLYPVRAFNGKEEKGLLAFSVDYLQATVSQTASGHPEDLLREIANILRRHKARAGYAVLEGVTRPVWAIPQSELKLKGQKKPRPTLVEVTDKL